MTDSKKSRSLPFKSAEHGQHLEKVLAMSKINTMLIDGNTSTHGLYCGMTFEALFFKAYPILTSPPMSKGLMTADGSFVLGVSHPKYVFSALEKAFTLCYPAEDIKRIVDWELWKFNTAYYGESVVKESPNWASLVIKSATYRCTGGSCQVPSVNIGKECALQRNELSIPLTDLPEEEGVVYIPWQYALGKYQKAQELRKMATEMNSKVESALLRSEQALEKMDME